MTTLQQRGVGDYSATTPGVCRATATTNQLLTDEVTSPYKEAQKGGNKWFITISPSTQ